MTDLGGEPTVRSRLVVAGLAVLVLVVGSFWLWTVLHGVLFAGVFGLARGTDPARSNALMRWRVLLQFGAIALFMLLVWLTGR